MKKIALTKSSTNVRKKTSETKNEIKDEIKKNEEEKEG